MNESLIKQYRVIDRYTRCYSLGVRGTQLVVTLEPGVLDKMRQGYVHPTAYARAVIEEFGTPDDFSFTQPTFGYGGAGTIEGDTLVFDFTHPKPVALSATMYFTFLYLERWMKKADADDLVQLLHVIPTVFPTQVHALLFTEGYNILPETYLSARSTPPFLLGVANGSRMHTQDCRHDFEQQRMYLCTLAELHTELMVHCVPHEAP